MTNPGNTGHGGYKNQKIIAVTPKDTYVEIALACGHTQEWHTHRDETPAQYAERLLTTSIQLIKIGKTRLKCEECREVRA